MKTGGRPLKAKLEHWFGPDYTPATMSVYVEDGGFRPFETIIKTKGFSDSIGIRNTSPGEYPLTACVDPGVKDAAYEALYESPGGRLVQGAGTVVSFPFPAGATDRVQVMLKTDGRNMKARVELMQGPNNDKQIIEYYASDGKKTPLYLVIETPGNGNVVRIINQNTVEFPFKALVEPL